MHTMPDDLIAGEPDRWRLLVALLGEPTNDAEVALFVFLARYTLPGSLAVLEGIVSRHRRYRADCRELVGRVAAALAGWYRTNSAGTPS
jgi:hypothetical protein